MSDVGSNPPNPGDTSDEPLGEGRAALVAVTAQLRGLESHTETVRRRGVDVVIGEVAGRAWRVTCNHAKAWKTSKEPAATGSLTISPVEATASSGPEALEWLEQVAVVARRSLDAEAMTLYADELLASAPNSIPVRRSTEILLAQIAFLAGDTLMAVWRSFNKAYRTHALNNDSATTVLEITLGRSAAGEVRHYQQYDDEAETLVFESYNDEARLAMAAIGYEVHRTGTWQPPSLSQILRGIPPPPDTALGHLAGDIAKMLEGPWV